MVNADEAELEQRLETGEWLTPGAAAKLLGIPRSTMSDMLARGDVRSATKPGSRHRICNPEDVQRMLRDYRAGKAAARGEAAEGQPAPE